MIMTPGPPGTLTLGFNVLMYLLMCRKEFAHSLTTVAYLNPFEPSGVKWLHFKVFRAILV